MTEFANYREISAKLKKRFSLRKPNYLEAAEAFKNLAQELSDFKEYSGFTLYSAAQCHHNNVVLLQEQRAKSNNGVNIFLSSGGSSSSATFSSSSSARLSRPRTAVSSNLLGGASGSLSSVDLGRNRILAVAEAMECQAWLDAARRLREAKEINGVIACYWHASQTCSPQQMSMVYYEWANMFQHERMYQEAADIYLEGGMLHEAIHCLLAGQHLQDAYHCYQELIASLRKSSKPTNTDTCRKQRTSSRLSSFSTASANSAISVFKEGKSLERPSPTPSTSSQQSTNTQKSSNPFVNFFTKKAPTAEETQSQSRKSKEESDRLELERETECALSHAQIQTTKCDRNAFLCKSYLSSDDHINIFLLKLYLYNPVNYEVPIPIVPLPHERSHKTATGLPNADPKDSDNHADCNNITKNQIMFSNMNNDPMIQEKTPPAKAAMMNSESESENDDLHRFVSLNDSSWFVRSREDLVEINMLFETLFSSLKNELKRTVDHESKLDMELEQFAEPEVARSSDANDKRDKIEDRDDDKIQNVNLNDSADDSSTCSPTKSHLRDHQNNGFEALESMLEKAASERQKLDQEYDSVDESDKNILFDVSIRRSLNDVDDEWSLQQSIKHKLFPLLNPVQNHILSLILDK